MDLGGGVLGLSARRRDVGAARRDRGADRPERRRGRPRVRVEGGGARRASAASSPNSPTLADGFDDNPFPASIEVRVRPERASATAAPMRWSARGCRCRAWPTSATTANGWRASAQRARRLSAAAGLALALLMALAAAVTVATVVRLGCRRGATNSKSWSWSGRRWPSFAGPSWPKGFLQGGVGALLAIAALWLGFMVCVRLVGAGPEQPAGWRRRAVPADSALRYLVARGDGGGSAGGSGRRAARRLGDRVDRSH